MLAGMIDDASVSVLICLAIPSDRGDLAVISLAILLTGDGQQSSFASMLDLLLASILLRFSNQPTSYAFGE